MDEKKKYSQSETIVVKRSSIQFAPYNPKKHSREAIAEQKKNIKRVGILGGIVWNRVTGNLVSGHKRTMALDEINKYDGSPETDYDVKVEMVEFDEKTEKEQNVYMDANATNTPQDVELLARIIPDIDFRHAGLTEQDLTIIGVDYVLQTEGESSIADEINEISSDRDARIAHNKEVKKLVNEAASEDVKNQDAYVVLSFDTFNAKSAFMIRFGLDKHDKTIKGEIFSDMVERVQ
jgi:hypothetical protein